MDSPSRLYRLLRWSEKYTKTDMVYLAHGGFWLTLEQVFGALFALLLAVAFGHLASQDTYGNYKYVLSLAAIFGAFSLTGLSTAITQAVARGCEGSLKQGVRLNLRWSGGVILFSIVGAAYYLFAEHNAFATAGLILVAFFSPVISSFSLSGSFFIGKKDFRSQMGVTLYQSIIPTIAVIVALFAHARAITLVAVYLATSAAVNLYLYRATLRRAANDRPDPNLLAYGAHLSVMGIVNAVVDKIDSVIIFSFLGPAQLAVYAYAIAIPEQLKGLLKQITPLSIAKLSARPLEEIKDTLWPKIRYLLIVTGLIMVVYILAAPFLFHMLFPNYLESIVYSQYYAASLILSAIGAPLSAVMQAHRKTRGLYYISNIGAVALLISLPLLTYWYGIAGAIASQIFYRGATTLTAYIMFRQLRED